MSVIFYRHVLQAKIEGKHFLVDIAEYFSPLQNDIVALIDIVGGSALQMPVCQLWFPV